MMLPLIGDNRQNQATLLIYHNRLLKHKAFPTFKARL